MKIGVGGIVVNALKQSVYTLVDGFELTTWLLEPQTDSRLDFPDVDVGMSVHANGEVGVITACHRLIRREYLIVVRTVKSPKFEEEYEKYLHGMESDFTVE